MATNRHTKETWRLNTAKRLAVFPALLVMLSGLGACGGGAGLDSGDFVWCVPYAREESGINIRGDAKTWWPQARTRYATGARPEKGSVLVLKADSRLRSGHLAVVSDIENNREILVNHANWGWDSSTRGRIYKDMSVIDVSSANDWSQVRFKHPDVGDYGRVYKAEGFIYNHTLVASR